MVWWVRFWENIGEEGRLPDATASGSRARLSSLTLSHSHATGLQYHPGDNVTQAGKSSQTTQDDGEGIAREKLLLEVRVRTNGEHQSQLMQRRAPRVI